MIDNFPNETYINPNNAKLVEMIRMQDKKYRKAKHREQLKLKYITNTLIIIFLICLFSFFLIFLIVKKSL